VLDLKLEKSQDTCYGKQIQVHFLKLHKAFLYVLLQDPVVPTTRATFLETAYSVRLFITEGLEKSTITSGFPGICERSLYIVKLPSLYSMSSPAITLYHLLNIY